MEQKCDIATRELDELREEVQRKKAEMERSHDTHRAVVAEADLRVVEMKKATYEFDRDIVRGAVNAVRKALCIVMLHVYANAWDLSV